MLDLMVKEGLALEEAAKRCGASSSKLTQAQLDEIIKKTMESEPEVVATIKSGADKKGAKAKYLQGLVMKETRGQANPKEVAESLARLLA